MKRKITTLQLKEETLGKLYKEINPILTLRYFEDTSNPEKISPTLIFSDCSSIQLSRANKLISKTQIKEILDQLADLITQICNNENSALAKLGEIVAQILEKVQNITDILELNDAQQKALVEQILEIIIDNINFTIKIKGFKIPNALIKAIMKPILSDIIMSLINYIEKIRSKQKTRTKQI